MAKVTRTWWARERLRAGLLGAVVLVVGSVLLAAVTGRLSLPASGHSEAVPAQPVKSTGLEDRQVVVEVKEAGRAEIESLEVSQEPEVGRLTVTTSHSLSYTPPPNFNGRVSGGFEACSAGGCRSGVVAIDVRAVNDSPIARDDSALTGQGKAVAIDVLANDTDPDGDRLSIRSVSDSPSTGSARIAGSWIVWTPRPGFQGQARVPYAAIDRRGKMSRASVTIRVGPSSVAPSTRPGVVEFLLNAGPAAEGPRDPFLQPLPPPLDNRPPQAAFDRVSVPAGGTVLLDVLANDRDPDGDTLSITSVELPDGGVAKEVGDRIAFTAPSASKGGISFAYSVSDRSGATSRTFVVVSVLQVSRDSAAEQSP